MELQNVKGIEVANGGTYNGSGYYERGDFIPHGMGVCTYRDHQEVGMYQEGVLDGIAYFNYHTWMQVGVAKDGNINGWGTIIDMGRISFGVFQNNELKEDLTPLVEVFWEKIKDECERLRKGIISALKTGEIFIGVPPYLLSKYDTQFGFHFLNSGDVFLGVSGSRETAMTGKFLHFDLNYNITRGEYEDRELISEITNEDFISACDIFVNREYMNFDISKNYSP
jgi:hypothetical protein